MAGVVTVKVVESRLKEVIKAHGHVCLFSDTGKWYFIGWDFGMFYIWTMSPNDRRYGFIDL